MVQVARILIAVLALIPFTALAQNPCSQPHQRALVMGGGGSKGAFQAGAVYHLIQHRGCDFAEISGASVGALNGAVLAQAGKSDDATSLSRLQVQADSLVLMWESIKGSRDVVKGRPLATLRYGLFGLESLKNFEPLHKLLEKNVSPERLETGRTLRIGTVSFHDGRYHELVLNADGVVAPHAIDHLFGSAILPMFGTMPRIPDGTGSPVQFGDAGLRHTTPVNSYFQVCVAASASPESSSGTRCSSLDGSTTPPHRRIEQLFVITTSPYDRAEQMRPVFDQGAFATNTRQIRDGRRIMSRALDLLMDTMYRSDLDTMYLTNDLLRWQATNSSDANVDRSLTPFPIRSYNIDAAAPTLSRPYDIAVIVPFREDAEITAMLDFSPTRIANQLYCGCVAADRMMQSQFGAEPMAGKCADRFPPKPARSKQSRNPAAAVWPSNACASPNTSSATTSVEISQQVPAAYAGAIQELR